MATLAFIAVFALMYIIGLMAGNAALLRLVFIDIGIAGMTGIATRIFMFTL